VIFPARFSLGLAPITGTPIAHRRNRGTIQLAVTQSGLADAGSAIGGAGTGRTGSRAVGIFVLRADVIGNSADYKSTAMQMGKRAG
jgi:hypothetical protein